MGEPRWITHSNIILLIVSDLGAESPSSRLAGSSSLMILLLLVLVDIILELYIDDMYSYTEAFP